MHHLFEIITTIYTHTCLADYTGLIKEKCFGHSYENPFNACVAAILAGIIGSIIDFFFGRTGKQQSTDSTPSDYQAVESNGKPNSDFSKIFE